MKQLAVLFLSIFVLSLTSSCNRENEPDRSTEQSDFYENLQGQEYLDYYTTPNVFFNMAQVNESTKSE